MKIQPITSIFDRTEWESQLSFYTNILSVVNDKSANIQHSQGHLARLFVPALTQDEAEEMVNEWFEEDVE